MVCLPKEKQAEPGHHISAIHKLYAILFRQVCHQDSVTFHTGKHLLWMTAEGFRISAGFADSAGFCGKSHDFKTLLLKNHIWDILSRKYGVLVLKTQALPNGYMYTGQVEIPKAVFRFVFSSSLSYFIF